jgi:DeoR family fructose operon transcriptional repressor
MKHVERRKAILDTILEKGSVKAEALAREYEVGVPTIRRDLKYLAEEYGIELAYGGAYAKNDLYHSRITELNISQKKMVHLEEKRMIAKKAAGIVNDNETIALNAGSTVELILEYLPDVKNLNVITLSLNVALKASNMSGITVYMPGGKLRNYSGAFYGSESDQFLRRFNIDKAFMGVLAVSLDKGVTHSSIEEISTNQTLVEISNRCYLVADYSKFDKVSVIKMLDLDIFEAFIVDDKIPKHYIQYAANNGINII